jgi:DNA modification methylase
LNKVIFGDCRETMRRWKEQGIKAQTCVTSPPYYGLRDYGTAKWDGGDVNCDHVESENKHGGQRADRNQEGYKKQYKDVCKKCGAIREDNQLGLEETPQAYIKAMVEVFRCVWDVLADDGTLWLNIGDSYSAGKVEEGLKPKDLIGIPWMLAFALRADGWYLRQDIIWHKPNPMPESVQDRCTKAHEYIFLLSKSQKYYYNHEAIKELSVNPEASANRYKAPFFGGEKHESGGYSPSGATHTKGMKEFDGNRNKRSVWTVTTKPYSGAHFAVFPAALIEPCILAGAPVGGIVLDPFMGSGTTGQVSQALGRQWIGCELNLKYVDLQNDRTAQSGMVFK